MNKKDPRVIKTLRQIDQALLYNLEKTPFEKITIDMICSHALINRSTFYKYYVDKYDLLNNYISRVLDDFKHYANADFVAASPATIDDDIYRSAFIELIRYLYSQKDVYLILWNAKIDRNIWVEMIDICEKEIIQSVTNNNPTALSGPSHLLSDSIGIMTPVTSPGGARFNETNSKFLDLYARLFASDLMNVIQWWFNNDPIITENDVLYVMNNKMKNGLFRAFKDYI